MCVRVWFYIALGCLLCLFTHWHFKNKYLLPYVIQQDKTPLSNTDIDVLFCFKMCLISQRERKSLLFKASKQGFKLNPAKQRHSNHHHRVPQSKHEYSTVHWYTFLFLNAPSITAQIKQRSGLCASVPQTGKTQLIVPMFWVRNVESNLLSEHLCSGGYSYNYSIILHTKVFFLIPVNDFQNDEVDKSDPDIRHHIHKNISKGIAALFYSLLKSNNRHVVVVGTMKRLVEA